MRRAMFWIGCAILFVILPSIYGVQAWMIEAVPPMQIWIWACLIAGGAMIYFGRNRDDVLRHHVA